jgi:hypothetical protein
MTFAQDLLEGQATLIWVAFIVGFCWLTYIGLNR